MRYIIRILKPWILKYILSNIEKSSFRDMMVNYVNNKLDIPHLTELQESELLSSVYTATMQACRDAIEKI